MRSGIVNATLVPDIVWFQCERKPGRPRLQRIFATFRGGRGGIGLLGPASSYWCDTGGSRDRLSRGLALPKSGDVGSWSADGREWRLEPDR
jgi:hypothetical protein